MSHRAKKAAIRAGTLALALGGVLSCLGYATADHEKIIDQAFPGMTDHQRTILKTASKRVDGVANGGQLPANSYQHAMRAPGQSVQDAARLSAEFIESNQRQAQQRQMEFERRGGRGISDDALDFFGNALHTVTDATSPAHEGYQVWDLNPFHMRAHERRESAVGQDRIDEAARQARELFRETFGEALLTAVASA